MAREIISFPESWMAEIIEVIEAGLDIRQRENPKALEYSRDVQEMLIEWCEDRKQYARAYDRRN